MSSSATTSPAKVNEWDKMLASHDAQISVLSDRIGTVEKKIDVVLHDLNHISNSLAAQASRPVFDIVKIITTTKDIGILVGFTVAAIIYVTNASFSGYFAEIKNLKEDLGVIEQQLKARNKEGLLP